MSTCLGTVVKAPLSAMLIVFEMTHQFALVPALLIGMAVSMAVSKLTGSENFYDAILVQDGHELHRVRPPLDLEAWQDLPVSAIASLHPVVVDDMAPAALRLVLERTHYACFPLLEEGRLAGVLAREDIEAYLSTGAGLRRFSPISCGLGDSIHDISQKFLDNPKGLIVIVDQSEVVGVVTLHDILRAQAAAVD
jgi:CIC family chloride channel protein